MWFLLWLCIGFVAGALALFLIELWWFLTPSRRSNDNAPGVPMQFGAQFLPFRIPYELKQLLLSPGCDDKLKKKETCICVNLFVQFLYQEFRESKWFRRWIVKRLQMEFNDLLSRSAASKLLHDIKLRNFSVGTQFPVIKDIQVSKVTLAPDKDSFQDLDLTLDIDYRGGFEASVDVVALLGRRASLAVKVTRVAGQARLQMTRTPYSHWTFSFTHDPIMEFKVDSEFRGRPLPQLVPLIINQFRRTIRKKHVLPAYKVRYRPFFVNPFLQPAADPADYGHIESRGVVRVTVIKCTRLNLAGLIPPNKQNAGEIYCHLSTSWRPCNSGRQRRDESAIGDAMGSHGGNDNYVSMALRYVRHSSQESFGLILGKEYVPEKVSKMAIVVDVQSGSPADRAGFKRGDLIIAVNNVGITTERQAAKLLSNTPGEMLVLVERKLTNIDNEDDVSEQLTPVLNEQASSNFKLEFNSGDDFLHISYNEDDGRKSPSRQSEKLVQHGIQRSQSDHDLSKNANILEASSESDPITIRQDNTDQDDDSSSMRKIKSTNVLIPVPNGKNTPNDSISGSPSTSVGIPEKNGNSMNGEEQLSGSPNSSSPTLSRKQRIAAKATEKVAQVAQKWTTGKATVKDIWDRRQQRRKGDADNASISETMNVSGSMANSKSEDAELKFEVGDTASVSSFLLSPDLVGGRPRSRSHSEPDTSILSVAGVNGKSSNGKEDNKSDASDSSSRKAESSQPQNQGAVEQKKPQPATFHSQTKPVPSVGEPVWYQNFPVPLDEKSRYLNIVVYWREINKTASFDGGDPMNVGGGDTAADGAAKSGPTPAKTLKDQAQLASAPMALGYASVFLPEVLDDCSITKSLCHQQTYALRPPSVAVKLTPAVEKLMLHPGFDPRLCYGDVALGFQWHPEQEHSEILEDSTAAEMKHQAPSEAVKSGKQATEIDQAAGKKAAKKAAEITPEYIMADGHKWLSTHFQQSIVCHVCQKKVWLKSAYKCVQCGTVSHKKCIGRAAALLGPCGHIHETVAVESVSISADGKVTNLGEDHPDGGEHDYHSLTEMAADAVECMNSMMDEHEAANTTTAEGKRPGLTLSERLAGLRRRKPKADVAAASVGGGQSAVPTSLESLSNVNWGVKEDASPFHSLLYTKCGTYNEHMILAAKDLGKDLYTTLPVVERKAKINDQIDRLQTEIDQTTELRLELLKKAGGKGDKGQIAAELAKLDDKLQALAILMLHFCAGLQCCLDLEENLTNDALDRQERLSKNGIESDDVSEDKNAQFVDSLATVLNKSQSEPVQTSNADTDTVFTLDISDEEKEKSDELLTS